MSVVLIMKIVLLSRPFGITRRVPLLISFRYWALQGSPQLDTLGYSTVMELKSVGSSPRMPLKFKPDAPVAQASIDVGLSLITVQRLVLWLVKGNRWSFIRFDIGVGCSLF